MGRVTVPFGVRGWVHIQPLTADPAGLCDYALWWVGDGSDWCEVRVAASKPHGGALVAQFEGVQDRDAAARLRGREIGVRRAEMPAPADGEFYWADLIGLVVVNTQQYEFGRVTRILQTGANDVLVVAGDGGETLIPFIAGAIVQVDPPAGRIVVDWGEDY